MERSMREGYKRKRNRKEKKPGKRQRKRKKNADGWELNLGQKADSSQYILISYSTLPEISFYPSLFYNRHFLYCLTTLFFLFLYLTLLVLILPLTFSLLDTLKSKNENDDVEDGAEVAPGSKRRRLVAEREEDVEEEEHGGRRISIVCSS